MSGTNVNAFKADVEAAFAKAASVFSEVKTEVDQLVAKLEEDAAAVAPASAAEVAPSVPAADNAPAPEEPVGPGVVSGPEVLKKSK